MIPSYVPGLVAKLAALGKTQTVQPRRATASLRIDCVIFYSLTCKFYALQVCRLNLSSIRAEFAGSFDLDF